MTGISLIIANARSTNALPRDTMLTLAEAHPQLSNFVNACAERERDAATPADRPVSQDGFRMALAAAYQRGKRAAPPPQAPATRPSNTTTQDQSTPQRVNPLLRRAMDKATTSKRGRRGQTPVVEERLHIFWSGCRAHSIICPWFFFLPFTPSGLTGIRSRWYVPGFSAKF